MTRTNRLSGLRKLFKYNVAHGEVLPPDARVDPAGFPEDEFPIYCPECDYSLRSLPQQRCPECGRAFDRSRLLVEQYVTQRKLRHSGQERNRVRWMSAIGSLLCLGYIVLLGLAVYWVTPGTSTMRTFRLLLHAGWVVVPIVGVLWFFQGTTSVSKWNTARKKRRRVYEAIDRTIPSFTAFRKVQKFHRVFETLIAVGALLLLCLMCWHFLTV